MCFARADLLVQCCVANDLPFLGKREKVKPFQRETVEGQVLLAEVTGGGIRSRAVERKPQTAHWSVSSVASCFCVSHEDAEARSP